MENISKPLGSKLAVFLRHKTSHMFNIIFIDSDPLWYLVT